MIEVTRLDGSHFVLNCDIIETIEANPDTVISLTTQKKLLVRETPRELIELVIGFKRVVYQSPPGYAR
jgi:flagellar protein FlbD